MTINTPNAYLVLLDSLDNVDETPGKLGRRQLIWLDNQLKFLNDKPVILFCHHYPEKGNGKGLLDYEHLREIMDKHQQVKTLVFGHSHRWELSTEQSFYHLNIPSTAYTFQDEQPLGFVHANFGTDGLSIQLECLDDNHPWHEEHGILYYENPNFESNGKNEEFVQIRNVYPNPFNASTTIKFQLLDMDYVTVDLFTIHGRFVKSIMNNKHLLPREYEVKINADSLATGTYLVRVATSNQIKTHKIVLIK
jgi:3',5'-cyclic AMP phosphodiesterase CpdA